MSRLLILICLCFSSFGQIINFPDANFKNALVNTNCVDTDGDEEGDADADLNDDGEIDVTEALQVKSLIISKQEILSLEVIENFVNLEFLDCSRNELTDLDVTGLTNLKTLHCNVNDLTSLDVTSLTNLESLNCGDNELISLIVTGLAKLESLDCNFNYLISLNLTGLINLQDLDCGTNELTSLDIASLTNLEFLSCFGNELINLDVTGMTNLLDLKCGSNSFTSLDVTGLTNLQNLSCGSNSLTTLAVTGLTNLQNLNCIGSGSLTSLNVTGLINLETLSCTYSDLTTLDVTGLTNLQNLSCGFNNLTTLDVTGLTNLEYLYCANNELTSLDIASLTNLETLYCHLNDLTSLEVTGLTNLIRLYCSENDLTNLDVTGLIKLETLSCAYSDLTTLDVTGLTNLYFLECGWNNITNLDVTPLAKLRTLFCSYNDLTSLDVSGLTNLNRLNCRNNDLNSLLLKTGSNISDLSFIDNPDLTYICGNDYDIDEIKELANEYGLVNCEVNSYCSFTPGGKFYSLQGAVRFDQDDNGCDDEDLSFPNLKFNIANDNNSGTFISNISGDYSISVQEGSHTVTPIFDNPKFEVTPSSYDATFPSASDTITQDICIVALENFSEIDITILPLSPPARPGFDASYKVIWENVGTVVENGVIDFRFDETLLDYVSATVTPDLNANGSLNWAFVDLLPFEKREIIVTLNVNSPVEVPPVNVDDVLVFDASLGDENFRLANTVVGSYDPNDKTCLQGTCITPEMIGDYVDYMIRFENTGNYAAENVVVKDSIDIGTFDISTLQVTDASHEVWARIRGNVVEFIFENIQLPFEDETNDGYVAFKIKTLSTLTLEDNLQNVADIYFDFNPPIRTNQTFTIIEQDPNIQPIIECYETASYDTITCQWILTGDMPEEPSLMCYEEAMFNSMNCMWEVSGNMPEQPTLACNESALFDPIDCEWNITNIPCDDGDVCTINDVIDIDCICRGMFLDTDSDGVCDAEDCAIENEDIYPGAPEICDDFDNNCDGQIDEGLDFVTYYLDEDNDGFGDDDSAFLSCTTPLDAVVVGGDCDDDNPDIYPGADDIPNNGIDEDCDGEDFLSSTVDFSSAVLSIYPNPVSEILFIDVVGKLDFQVSILDVQGSLILIQANVRAIDVSNIQSGQYTLQIVDKQSNQKLIQRIVVGK